MITPTSSTRTSTRRSSPVSSPAAGEPAERDQSAGKPGDHCGLAGHEPQQDDAGDEGKGDRQDIAPRDSAKFELLIEKVELLGLGVIVGVMRLTRNDLLAALAGVATVAVCRALLRTFR